MKENIFVRLANMVKEKFPCCCIDLEDAERIMEYIEQLKSENERLKNNPSVGIYYRDGKPMKGKPKKEQL